MDAPVVRKREAIYSKIPVTFSNLSAIISAFPMFDNGGIPAKKAKMAMALYGKNKQYHFAMIQPRHFLSTAARVGFSADLAFSLMQEMATRTEDVIASVTADLPAGFPEQISKAIFLGLASQAARIIRGETCNGAWEIISTI